MHSLSDDGQSTASMAQVSVTDEMALLVNLMDASRTPHMVVPILSGARAFLICFTSGLDGMYRYRSNASVAISN
jgi:hypothetical protein